MSVWQIAFETSSRQGSVALLREDVPISQITLDPQSRTAQTLAPAVEELLKALANEGGTLGLVSVAHGPGSFTGLRIGVTAAKALAFARDCPIVGCDTLEVLIHATMPESTKLTESSNQAIQVDAAINAYRGQVFRRREIFDPQEQTFTIIHDSEAIDTDQWFAELNKDAEANSKSTAEDRFFVVGDVWSNFQSKLTRSDACLHVLPQNYWYPTAVDVGKLAWTQYCQGDFIDAFALTPKYLRESAAVEKRKQSQGM